MCTDPRHAATRMELPEPGNSAVQYIQHLERFFLLQRVALDQHLFEHPARAIRVANFHVGTCEFKFGGNALFGFVDRPKGRTLCGRILRRRRHRRQRDGRRRRCHDRIIVVRSFGFLQHWRRRRRSEW